MFCDKCGTEINEGKQFCSECGKKVDTPVNIEGIKNLASEKLQDGISTIKEQTESYQAYRKEELSREKIAGVEDVFVDENEQQIAVLGMGYLSSFIRGEGLSKGFAILSNKRFYFRGKCLRRSGIHYIKSSEERSVDLQDITSSGFVYYHNILLLVVAIISSVISLLSIPALGIGGWSALLLMVPVIIIFWVPYFLSRKRIYEVCFAGGVIALRASKYGIKETRKFDKKLRKEKDKLQYN